MFPGSRDIPLCFYEVLRLCVYEVTIDQSLFRISCGLL